MAVPCHAAQHEDGTTEKPRPDTSRIHVRSTWTTDAIQSTPHPLFAVATLMLSAEGGCNRLPCYSLTPAAPLTRQFRVSPGGPLLDQRQVAKAVVQGHEGNQRVHGSMAEYIPLPTVLSFSAHHAKKSHNQVSI